ncbi:alpha/beta fold hydrolase [Pseudoteredinibacter isoporae]|uniref:Alpha-beta hydrolase superfamily lysophospholipase n=1 Tax=Pseudoteredinibacter isoporae TaxID=570281 RepID=A0A7X0MWM8_9GAMM|nr:alpha-beta hydrolase superfamily lysophospholipase [Pseudoteredinibacter isoporae]NHO88412.1 alpha/beta hydrolase [Pseudoteredinibacter isoporae]NIB23257.1 alpha/beta hydrolase [Pseudoteredinibacter isoporae]
MSQETLFEEWQKEIPGDKLYRCSWRIEKPKAIVQLAHGMGEHIGRYDGFARFLNAQGYSVYGADHRGHGKSSIPSSYGHMGKKGWEGCLDDMAEIADKAREQNPDIPLFLFGHSMGAALSQQLITDIEIPYDGVILSGSPGFVSPLLAKLGRAVSRFESWRRTDAGNSGVLKALVFDGNNKAFKNDGDSGYEWLSRDEAQVQAYVDDPACGFVLSNGSMAEFFNGLLEGQKAEAVRAIPTSMAMLILSGSADPVHQDTKNLRTMRLAYEQQGLNPDYTLYRGGRHEMLNESNSEQVYSDILSWLDAKVDA